MPRRNEGDETWYRLLNWSKSSKAAERLSTHILRTEGFTSIDPSHPLGGKDGLKDMVAVKENINWIGASYFPRGQQTFTKIKAKFQGDFKGIVTNGVNAIAFVTNQELTLKQRNDLKNIAKPYTAEIYHLERVASLLDIPKNYGIRLEFLDIELTKEEQVSYFAAHTEQLNDINKKLELFITDYQAYKEDIIDAAEFEDRSQEEISEAMSKLLDIVWYNRHLDLRYRLETKQTTVAPHIWEGALKSAKKVEEKYSESDLGPFSDFEWGMINGKLSALRWVFGEEWDMLDT